MASKSIFGIFLSISLLLACDKNDPPEVTTSAAVEQSSAETSAEASASPGPALKESAGARRHLPSQQDAQDSDEQATATGQWYRAVFQVSNFGELPFFINLPPPPDAGWAIIANGDHRIAGRHTWHGRDGVIEFPVLRTRILLHRNKEGMLHGHFNSHAPTQDARKAAPFRAVPLADGQLDANGQPSEASRFAPPTSSDAGERGSEFQPAGVWEAEFTGMGKSLIHLSVQKPNLVTAVVEFTNGTAKTLYGNHFGDFMKLSSFDASIPLLIHVWSPGDTDQLQGVFTEGIDRSRRDTFVAKRHQRPRLASDWKRFRPNRDVINLAQMGLSPYRGKPLIIEFAGSWCRPCSDVVPVLKEIRQKHPEVEVVTMLFELLDDRESTEKQAEIFIEEHGISWELIPVVGDIEPHWEPLQRDFVDASPNLPVTFFVNANGTVRDIHMGFPDRQAGHIYERERKEYIKTAAALARTR